MFFISNLAAGLENSLNDPSFLLNAVEPFKGEAGIEFFLHYHDEAYRAKMEKAHEWLGSLPRTVHGPFLRVEATSEKGTPGYDFLFAAYGWAFEIAEKLGCHEMVFHTHQRVIEEGEKARAQQVCMENLNRLVEMGREHGVTLLIENLGIQKKGVSLFDEDDFIRLVNAFPQAQCLIDTGHLNVAGWNAARVLEALSDRIVGYHLHNNDSHADSHQPIGEGTFNYPAFYDLYRRFTPNASLTLEYGDGPAVTPRVLSADLAKVIIGVSGK